MNGMVYHPNKGKPYLIRLLKNGITACKAIRQVSMPVCPSGVQLELSSWFLKPRLVFISLIIYVIKQINLSFKEMIVLNGVRYIVSAQ